MEEEVVSLLVWVDVAFGTTVVVEEEAVGGGRELLERVIMVTPPPPFLSFAVAAEDGRLPFLSLTTVLMGGVDGWSFR